MKKNPNTPEYANFARDCAAALKTRATILRVQTKVAELRRDSRLAEIRYRIATELLAYMRGGETREVVIEMDDDAEGVALIEHLVTVLKWPRELLHWSSTLCHLEILLTNQVIEELIRQNLGSE